MKKFLIIMLALFLAVPAISYAGSVTSRYDVTIGGYVKFDMGYNTKGVGADYTAAPVGSYKGYQQQNDEYGNFFAAAGETNLNFLVKGPDGWGAKTSAYIEGDFEGKWSGATYGVFNLRHAWMRLDWGKTKLTIGQQWQAFGLVPTYGGNLLSFDLFAPMMKGTRQPQIVLNTQINKNWAYMVGLMSPSNTLAQNGGANVVNSYTRSSLPFAEGEITWTTDSCGKIGPWQMLFGVGGFYGSTKDTAFYNPTPTTRRFVDDTSPTWAAIFKGYIPVIPEKKGNKTGALALSGTLFMGQNWSWMGGPPPFATTNTSYVQATSATSIRSASPTMYGGWGQLTYYFADNVFVNGYYGYITSNLSNTYRNNSANYIGAPNGGAQNIQHVAANICYDVNPAMRIAFEWNNVYTRYANIAMLAAATPAQNKNSFNSFRVGAWYFF